MKTKIYFLIYLAVLLLLTKLIVAQGVSVSDDNSEADPSALLEIKSASKGLLIPRMTQAEIGAVATPANGLLVFSTTDNKFYAYILSENVWKEIAFNVAAWACGDILTDTRDNQTYNTVQIGTQCWMAENLNIGTMINGSNNQTDNSIIEKYCYDNSSSNCDTYGGLYQWDEMMGYSTTEGTQGICPVGWHVPSDDEWCLIENEVDAGAISCSEVSIGWRGIDAGANLKETGTDHWASPNSGATNLSGFTSIPGGYHNSAGFYGLTFTIYYWSSTEYTGLNVWYRNLYYTFVQIQRDVIGKTNGFSVRCLLD